MSNPISEDCSSGLHEYCTPCECSCHKDNVAQIFPVEGRMPRIPEFHATLAKIAQLHEAKNQDYATDKDPFSNFVFTETTMELFNNNADKTFVWPIATKLARLSVLLSKTGLPNFESIEDSFDDIATYVILWKCAYMRAHNPQAQQYPANESLGRLNYAGQSDEGKPPGQSHFHDSQRRTTTADERVQGAFNRIGKQDS